MKINIKLEFKYVKKIKIKKQIRIQTKNSIPTWMNNNVGMEPHIQGGPDAEESDYKWCRNRIQEPH
jgi:hypothetical protein